MDKEWLKYWQKVEDLEVDETEEKEREKINNLGVEEAKDLFKSFLSDDN